MKLIACERARDRVQRAGLIRRPHDDVGERRQKPSRIGRDDAAVARRQLERRAERIGLARHISSVA